MTIQAEQPKELPTLVEHVLVIGNEKLWAEYVHAQSRENEFYTHHINRMRLDIYDDILTSYHFVSANNGDESIIQHLRGKEFHRWLNLGCWISTEVRGYISTRVRLK
jgi:hypothetical protein